jgi:hypothetical protein
VGRNLDQDQELWFSGSIFSLCALTLPKRKEREEIQKALHRLFGSHKTFIFLLCTLAYNYWYLPKGDETIELTSKARMVF